MISNADLHRWFAEHGGQPDLVVDPDGTRTVRWAGQYLRTRPGYWEGRVLGGHDLSDVVQPDGTLKLDTVGEWRYRALKEMPDGFTVYEQLLTERVEIDAYDAWERDQARRPAYAPGAPSNVPGEILRRVFAQGERVTAGKLNDYLRQLPEATDGD